MESTANEELQVTFDGLSEAWRKGDGAAFADWCTDDVDFINILGMHVKGRPAVADLHNKIFSGPYKGSTVKFSIESVRTIAPNAALVVAPARVDIPSGPVKGIVATVASVLLMHSNGGWKVANFQNTRREATESDHLAIMRDAVK